MIDQIPPSRVELAKEKNLLILAYPDEVYELTSEYLRVHSPSAEVRGHGAGNEILQTGKKQVLLTGVEPVGNYGLKLIFNDGHDSGIYDWNYLKTLAENKELNWQNYLARLQAAGASR